MKEFLQGLYEAMGGVEMAEKVERVGRLHSFAQVAYGWHDLAMLVSPGGGDPDDALK